LWSGDGEEETASLIYCHFCFSQFGAGYNSCIGRNLALIEISKVTATVLRDFDIRQVNPGQSWKYESHFTAVPYGWPCYVTRRRNERCLIN